MSFKECKAVAAMREERDLDRNEIDINEKCNRDGIVADAMERQAIVSEFSIGPLSNATFHFLTSNKIN